MSEYIMDLRKIVGHRPLLQVGAKPETVQVEGHPQRAYFCFHDYDYYLDVSKQIAFMQDVKPLEEGLQESYEWFRQNRDAVMRRPYMEYIDTMVTS